MGCDASSPRSCRGTRPTRSPTTPSGGRGSTARRVLTHFPPVDTYNAELRPDELAHASANFADHRWSRQSLVPYGHGDGGGGPTREMLARAHRMADLDGMPAVRLGTPDEFFTDVEAEIAAGAASPCGGASCTSRPIAARSRASSTRRSATGAVSGCCTSSSCGRRRSVVDAGVDHLWREVLTQQFHDILPGSSIAWVHAEAEDGVRPCRRRTRGTNRRRARRARRRRRRGRQCGVPVRREVVILDPGLADRVRRRRSTVLSTGDTAVLVDAEPCVVDPLVAVDSDHAVVVTDRSMSNGRLAVRWDQAGALISVIDVATARELVPAGRLSGRARTRRRPSRGVRRMGCRGVDHRWRAPDRARLTTTNRSRWSSTARCSGACDTVTRFGPSIGDDQLHPAAQAAPGSTSTSSSTGSTTSTC